MNIFKSIIVFITIVFFSGCGGFVFITPDHLDKIKIPVKIDGIVQITIKTGEVLDSDHIPYMGFCFQDQKAFLEHLRNQLETNLTFTKVYLKNEIPADYKIIVDFKKTVREKRVYYFEVELKIFAGELLSFEKLYNVRSTSSLKSFHFGSIGHMKLEAANKLLHTILPDLEEWANGISKSKINNDH